MRGVCAVEDGKEQKKKKEEDRQRERETVCVYISARTRARASGCVCECLLDWCVHEYMIIENENTTPPEIHKIEKLRLLGISWYKFKTRF